MSYEGNREHRYERKIRYMEYLKNGEKQFCAGFVKIERIENLCNIQVTINRTEKKGEWAREVVFWCGESKICPGKLFFKEGKAEGKWKDVELSYDDLTQIEILLDKDRCLQCIWRQEAEANSNSFAEAVEERDPPQNVISQKNFYVETVTVLQPEFAAAGNETRSNAAVTDGKIRTQSDTEAVMEIKAQPAAAAAESESSLPSAVGGTETEVHSYTAMEKSRKRPRPIPRLYEDKWQQLADLYPHKFPFQDERDYLCITPADFVVLQKQYHKLVSNSFLLHGFYNYEHLILARMIKNGKERYYIGVPGNFYEKERQAAILFGFESFECKKEPVSLGEFGYFMISVEI